MRKIYSTLISLMVMILVGCGNNDEAAATTKIEAPATVVEKTTEESQAKPAEEISKPSEEASTPTEPDESSYYVNGAFSPKLYAAQFDGFKEYPNIPNDSRDFFSITCNDVEYFIIADWGVCFVYYTDSSRCYSFKIHELPTANYNPECKIKTNEVFFDDSNVYLESLTNFLDLIASGNGKNMQNWEFTNIPYGYTVFNCNAEYTSDGFIDDFSLYNVDDGSSFTHRVN